jgi:hypothetical protein
MNHKPQALPPGLALRGLSQKDEGGTGGRSWVSICVPTSHFAIKILGRSDHLLAEPSIGP